jgi:hypothetical protein
VTLSVACTSVPIRYYTLSPPTDEPPRASEAALTIDVRRVDISPQVNHTELAVRTGQTEVTLLDNERWASPLKDEIKEALELELQRRVVQRATSFRSFRRLTLDIDVHRFEAELGRSARLEASWRAILSGEGAPLRSPKVATCTFQANEAISTGYGGMVEGYQREIAALAEAIVVALTSATTGNEAPCGASIGD